MSSKKFEKEYFEDSHFSKLGGYDLLTRLNSWRPKRYRKILLDNISHHETLLDIGCAYGHFLEILKNDFKVSGMDISNHAIKIARNKVKCRYKQGNLEESIPFKEKFDIITAISVIEHLHEPEKGLKTIFNHLNDNGLFCFEIPTVSNKISTIFYKLFFSHDNTHIFIKSVDEIERLIKSVGFKKIAIYSSMFPIFTKKKNFIENFSFVFGIFKKVI